MGKKPSARSETDLEELIARITLINPTGRGLRRAEERARYAEKARLQSLLIEHHPDEVRVRVHDDLPGIVSLSVPRLQASAAHAALDALSARARAIIETQILTHAAEDPPAPFDEDGQDEPRVERSRIEEAQRYLAEYDFDCAIEELAHAVEDTAAENAERMRAGLLLLEIHVDHLANDQAALTLEPTLRTLGSLPERAHELLGIAASRLGEITRALHHLGKCRGERVGEALATIARTSAQQGAWPMAYKAWTHLNALAAMTEPPLSTSISALCSEVRRSFELQAVGASPEEMQADDDLERFVREFAPQHPWLRARRHHEQAARMRALLRSTLLKAQHARTEGDYEGVLRCVETLTASAPLSAAESAEVETLVAWAEERRALAQATRALTLASSDDAEAACRTYVALSARAKQFVRERGSAPLFETIDALHEVCPDQSPSRALLRAAIAWIAARELEPHAQWHLLAPHASQLERVPAFALELQRLRRTCMQASEPAEPVELEEHEAPTREVYFDGVRFWIADEPLTPPLRIVDVAPQVMRIGAETFLLTLEVLVEDAEWALSLWPCHGAAKGGERRCQIEGFRSGRPRRVFAARNCACIVDDQGTWWLVHFGPGLCVHHVRPHAAQEMAQDTAIVWVDDEHLAFELADGAWRVVRLHTGATRTELAPRMLWARSAKGGHGYRNAGLCIERVDNAGRAVDHFELPRNVTPRAILESPLGERPIVLGTATLHAASMVWWQPEPRFFRAIEVFNEGDHGAYFQAVTLPERGILIFTRHPSGMFFLHELIVDQGMLRPTPRREEIPRCIALVSDPSGRRAWLVQRGEHQGIEIRSLSISKGEG